jgi:hypothetical protein
MRGVTLQGGVSSVRGRSVAAPQGYAKDRAAADLAYKAQDSVQTLADALEEYYKANPGRMFRPGGISEETRVLFCNHDICRVIFGLDTTPKDEAMADMRMLFSTDVGWGRYIRYLSSDKAARSMFGKSGYGSVVAATIRATPRILRAFLQSLTTRKRWPWDSPDRFMIRSLKHLRREFHIKVI